MKHQNVILKAPAEDEWHLGQGLATRRFGGIDLNPSGDWSMWKSKDEAQSRTGFDTEACAVFHTLEAWITLARFYGYTDFPSDLSERYTGVFAGTTPQGTDPQVVAEVSRATAGVVQQEMMPWNEEVDTFEEYYDRLMAQGLLPLGKKLLDRFELGHEWVFSFGSSYTPAQKAELLRKALKRGTVCVSVDGSYQTDKQGRLKQVNAIDSHWVLLLSQNTLHDSYDPFIKQLVPNYDHNAAKVYFLKRKTEVNRNFWSIILDNIAKWIK